MFLYSRMHSDARAAAPTYTQYRPTVLWLLYSLYHASMFTTNHAKTTLLLSIFESVHKRVNYAKMVMQQIWFEPKVIKLEYSNEYRKCDR